MTPFEKRIWETTFGSLIAQRGWPISYSDMSHAIKTADSAVLGIRGSIGGGQLHEDDKLEAERLTQQTYQPPESAIEIATRLREYIMSTGEGGDAWDEHTMDEVMKLLDMVIGTPEDGKP